MSFMPSFTVSFAVAASFYYDDKFGMETAETIKSADKIAAKVRTGTLAKIPYLLVVGGRERDAGTVAVREYGVGERGVIPFEGFETECQ